MLGKVFTALKNLEGSSALSHLNSILREIDQDAQTLTEVNARVTYEQLNTNGDIGQVASTLAAGDDSRFTLCPTSGQKDALAGTSGTPSSTNKYITDADARIPIQGENDALVGTSGTPSSTNKYITDADARIPTQGENDALVGSAGTPSSTNKYLTQDDTTTYAGSYYVNNILRTTAQGSGSNIAYTGIGFQPKAIIFFGAESTQWISIGFASSVALSRCIRVKTDATEAILVDTSNIIRTTAWSVALVSFDADGFTITYTYGSGANLDFIYLAIR